MEKSITFNSDGLMLSGVLQIPDGLEPGERRPAWIALHGFGSHKGDGMVMLATRLFASLGYITLRFDMRGCGESEGPRGKVICQEQVQDTRNAVSHLRSLPQVDPDAVSVMGHSFGAAVAVYTAGVDERIAACISSGGWGDGAAKFRQQHSAPQAWSRFEALLRAGREKLAHGESMKVSRFDIVPIPMEMRGNLPAGSFMEFPFEVVDSMERFRPNEVIARIAPRPLLLLHPSVDTVTPTEQSIEMFRHAGMPTDLHLVSGIDHFIFSDDNELVLNVVRDWLAKHLPVASGSKGSEASLARKAVQ
jgi:alpha-beta hydrolase superfamily lysophospholipase